MDAGVPADNKVGGGGHDGATESNANFAHESLLFPVPEDDLPVGLAAERNQEAVTLGIEGRSNKFLTLVLTTLGLVIGQNRSLFVAHGFADSEDGLFAHRIALADAEKVALCAHGDVSDGFGALGACANR